MHVKASASHGLRVLAALSLALSLAAPCGCAPGQDGDGAAPAGEEGTVRVTVPTRVVNLSRQAVDDLAGDLREAGEGHYDSIEVLGTEGVDHELVVEMPESERRWWVSETERHVAEVADSFAELGDSLGQEGYRLDVSDDYTQEDYYYNLAADPDDDIVPHLSASEYYCAMRQLFAGGGGGEWSVTTTIRNCDTGKVVTSATSGSSALGGGLAYGEDDWARSYE